MIDVVKIRKALACMAVEDYDAMGMIYGGPVKLGADMGAALDELEALRKPVAPCRFNVAAARAELALMNANFESGGVGYRASYRAAVALLDKALAAIDAGWPAVDIEGAAIAAWISDGSHRETWDEVGGRVRDEFRNIARAVLAHVGRTPVEPRPAAGVITEAHVEEAAIRAWCAPDEGGHTTTPDTWEPLPGWRKKRERNIARAVLEYAADRFSDGPALAAANREIDRLNAMLDARHPAPTVDPRAERLRDYRYAAVAFIDRGHDMTLELTAEIVERYAHAMLVAERTPDAR